MKDSIPDQRTTCLQSSNNNTIKQLIAYSHLPQLTVPLYAHNRGSSPPTNTTVFHESTLLYSILQYSNKESLSWTEKKIFTSINNNQDSHQILNLLIHSSNHFLYVRSKRTETTSSLPPAARCVRCPKGRPRLLPPRVGVLFLPAVCSFFTRTTVLLLPALQNSQFMFYTILFRAEVTER